MSRCSRGANSHHDKSVIDVPRRQGKNPRTIDRNGPILDHEVVGGIALPGFPPPVATMDYDSVQGGVMLGTILIGLIAGALAKLLMPGKDPGGFIVTILLGIVGAVLAKFLGQAMGLYRPDQSAGLIGATVGALLILAVYHLFRRRHV
jgi:uncharacterized membrane protein YeaQ/YmgE (transglycosylase-associated protein family)